MTIAFLGDSITYGHGLEDPSCRYATLVSQRLRMTEENYGISGTLMANAGPSRDNGQAFVSRVQAIDQADVAVIFGGTNDYFWSDAPMEGEGEEHFSCAVRSILQHVKQKRAGKLTLVVTPYPHHGMGNIQGGKSLKDVNFHDTDTVNFHGRVLADYVAVLEELCKEHGVPCLNLHGDFDFSWREHTQDGCHPNEEGHRRLAEVIAAKLEALLAAGKKNAQGMSIGQYRDRFKVNGRTSAVSEGITVDWSGSSLEFSLDCSGDVKISAVSSGGTSEANGYTQFTVHVDGAEHGVICMTEKGKHEDILIASGLPKGKHHFRLSKWAHAEHAQVEFTKLTFDGELLERPADKELFFEIIGDSLSCGYGNHDGFNDGTLSYGYLAAERLNADCSIVARSGLCLVNRGVTCVPDLYPYVSWYRDGGVPGGERYDFANARIPDVVIVNLGTNDYSYSVGEEVFAAAMKSFIAQIRANYGKKVPIVWVYGMMNDGYKDTIVSVMAELGGEATRHYTLGFSQNNAGVDAHPDTAHQRKCAEELAAYLCELLQKKKA